MRRLKNASAKTSHVLLAALALVLCGGLLVPSVRRRASSATGLFTSVPLTAFRLCRCQPTATIELRRPDGVKLVVDKYEVRGDRRESGVIILLHGNVPEGRQVAFYRVLAAHLADRGYVVYAPDFAGFGASGDPFEPLVHSGVPRVTPDNVWFADADVLTTLQHAARSHPGSSIGVVGHSGGADPALSVGSSDSRVERMVLMGPPVNAEALSRDSAHVSYFWRRAVEQRARLYHSGYPEWFSQEVWNDLRTRRTLEDFAAFLSGVGHKPVLLVHGAREKQANQDWLRSFVESMAPPVEYRTIPHSDHYGNAKNLLGFCLYDRRVAEAAAGMLAAWFAG